MGRLSQWGSLFDTACEVIGQAETTIEGKFLWSFGGGTALMLQIDHRESHDVDLFIDDPQILPYLNPSTQGYKLPRTPDEYDTDGTRMIKLIFDDLGEIDFICSADVTEQPSRLTRVRGVDVQLETAAEIVGKKIYYRGSHIQPRDMFDVAAVNEALGSAYVVDALKQCGAGRCAAALEAVNRWSPEAAEAIVAQLMHRESTLHLISQARIVTRDLLARSLT